MNTIKKAFVTGGAGFIGSHIVDRLLSMGSEVVVYDNLCTGDMRNLPVHPNLKVVVSTTLDYAQLNWVMRGCDAVFHFQANADVRGGVNNLVIDLEQNTVSTANVLEATYRNGIKTFVFASSATVYGNPTVIPTPEDSPLIQTSLYGASKLAGEAMIQAYSEYFDIRSFIFRFVSWIGPRYSHGVVIDFINKLKVDPNKLEILGNGTQRKSYLDVRDGVDGIFTAIDKAADMKNIFNLGNDQDMNVLDLAKIVLDETGCKDTELVTTGNESRGWVGDSPFVRLSLHRMYQLGWRPKLTIEEGIRSTVRDILNRK